MEEYDEYPSSEYDAAEVVAPAPTVVGRQWSWDLQTVLWVAGGVAALGFAVYFLTSYSSAKKAWVAEQSGGGSDGSGGNA